VTEPEDPSASEAPGALPDQDLAAETNVRVLGGDAGWTPAQTPAPPIPVLTPEALVRTAGERSMPIGTEPSATEVLHASTTVAATHAAEELAPTELSELSEPVPPADLGTTVAVVPAGRVVDVHHHGAERWAPILSAVVGTVVILGGLILGAVSAYLYGDPAACLAYSKAHHGATGFGCAGGLRKVAVLLPMIGLPLVVIGWLAWMWVPERSASFRVKQGFGLLGLFIVIATVALVAMGNAVR
jgi:hypothetical protein